MLIASFPLPPRYHSTKLEGNALILMLTVLIEVGHSIAIRARARQNPQNDLCSQETAQIIRPVWSKFSLALYSKLRTQTSFGRLAKISQLGLIPGLV